MTASFAINRYSYLTPLIHAI